MKPPTHFSDGGTGITNFTNESLAFYKLAIARYCGPSKLWISETPMLPMKCDGNSFCLCADMDKSMRPLDDFWAIYREVKAEHSAQPANAS